MKLSKLVIILSSAVICVSCNVRTSSSPKYKSKYNLEGIGLNQGDDFLLKSGSINDEIGFPKEKSFSFNLRPSSNLSNYRSESRQQSSESGRVRKTLESLRDSFRSSFTWHPSISSDNSNRNEDSPRSATSDQCPELYQYLVDVQSVEEVDWEDLPVSFSDFNLTENQNLLISEYADDYNHYDMEFKVKVYQSLIFIYKSYPINNFIINLALYTVNYYPNTAPNVLKKILDERFAFMGSGSWAHKYILGLLEPYMSSVREWKTLKLDPLFSNHIQSLCLDILHGKSQAHDLVMILMYIFHGTRNSTDFLERYALFLKTLISLAMSGLDLKEPLNVSKLSNILIFDVDRLEQEISTVFKSKNNK